MAPIFIPQANMLPEIYCYRAYKHKSPGEWEGSVSKEIQQRNYQMTQIFLSITKISSNYPDASISLVQGGIWYETEHTHTHTHTHRAWLQDDHMSPKLCWNHKNVKTSIKLVVDNDGAKAVEENSPQ